MGDSSASCTHCGLPVPVADAAAGGRPVYCCFGCRIASELARPAGGGDESHPGAGTLLLRIGLGVFLAMNVMAFSWLNYARDLLGASAERETLLVPVAGLFAYLLLLLTTVVLVALGGPLAGEALGAFGRGGNGRRGAAGSDLLILMGVGAAYVLSVLHTVRSEPGLYYDTAVAILVLVTVGRYLEAQAVRRAFAAARGLLAHAPARAWVRREGALVEVAAEEVRPGEVVRVRAGETSPVDGEVVDGRAHLDTAVLTGEARPRAVEPGDAVLAGTTSIDGVLYVAARRVGAARTLARAEARLHEARRTRPPMQRVADRVARGFVPLVGLVALAVFAVHAAHGDPRRGLFDALSVLLISCPCALGLAAPLAMHFALHRAARIGVLIDSPATLERAAAVTRLFLDKTGTLTERRAEVAHIEAAAGMGEEEALALAAALATASLHPVADALAAEAARRGVTVPAMAEVRSLPGLGVEGRRGLHSLLLGSARLLRDRGLEPGGNPSGSVWLAEGSRVVARFELRERVREDARRALARLRQLGVEISILSGDTEAGAVAVAGQLGLDCEAGLLPQDKLVRIQRARGAGRGAVAMVGDGVNDVPVLAGADVSFALGSGADLALQAASVVVLEDRLERVPATLALARDAVRAVKVCLGWAFAYNLAGVALAAAGMLTPTFAAVAMVGSSLVVVATARRAGQPERDGSALVSASPAGEVLAPAPAPMAAAV